MILHVCYSAASEGRVACLADLAGQFTRPGIDFRETLNEMLSYPHDPALKRGWRTTTGLQTATHPVVSEKAQEMLDKENKELSGVLSTAKTALALYSDPLVARNTSASVSPLTTWSTTSGRFLFTWLCLLPTRSVCGD